MFFQSSMSLFSSKTWKRQNTQVRASLVVSIQGLPSTNSFETSTTKKKKLTQPTKYIHHESFKIFGSFCTKKSGKFLVNPPAFTKQINSPLRHSKKARSFPGSKLLSVKGSGAMVGCRGPGRFQAVSLHDFCWGDFGYPP